jgi:hypothetical protein
MLRMSMLFVLTVATTVAQVNVTEVMRPRNYTPVVPASLVPPPNNGIQYQGGPVMNDPHGTNVYFIWYGNWSKSPVPAVLIDFINSIGGTAYFNINSSYYDFNAGGEKDPVVNRINYGGSVYDNYSLGTSLTDNDLGTILESAVFSGRLPNDPKAGVYFVLTSADVIETSGFCVYYCAFHGYDVTPNGENLPLGFIENPDHCPAGCSAQSITPNNSSAADGMANMIAHELSETVTDPFATSWINLPEGIENGDLCVCNFGYTSGKVKALPDGALYNAKFGGRPWLIQQIWVNAGGGYCGLSLDE